MKNLKLTIESISKTYKLLEDARYSKLEDDDKIKLWKISRVLHPIARKYNDDVADLQKKMMPSEDFAGKVEKAFKYEKMLEAGKTDELPITADEYNSIREEFRKYNTTVKKALGELSSKEESIDIEPLTENAFGKLMASNDWTLRQADLLGFIIEE